MTHISYAISKDHMGDVLAYDDEAAPTDERHILIWHPVPAAVFDVTAAVLGDVYMDSAAPGVMPRLARVTFAFFCEQAARLLGAGWAAFAATHHDYISGHPCGHQKPYRVTSGIGTGWAEHCACGHYGSGWRAQRREAVTSVSGHIALQAVAEITRARLARERGGEASA